MERSGREEAVRASVLAASRGLVPAMNSLRLESPSPSGSSGASEAEAGLRLWVISHASGMPSESVSGGVDEMVHERETVGASCQSPAELRPRTSTEWVPSGRLVRVMGGALSNMELVKVAPFQMAAGTREISGLHGPPLRRQR